MSGQEETLRLAAEVVNKWSGPLAEFRRDLQNLGKSTKGVHSEGKKHAEEHAKAFGELKHAVHEVGERVRSGLEPAFEAFGVTALSVAGAVAAVAEAIKGFAGSSRQLEFLSRETGFSIDKLHRFDELARSIGTSSGAMRAGLAGFSEHMAKVGRGAADELSALARIGPDIHHFAQSLVGLNRDAQLDKFIAMLDKIGPQDQKRRVLRAFSLPPELANLPGSEIRKILKDIAPLSDAAVKKGVALQESFDKLARTVEHLKEEIGTELAGSMTRLTEAITVFVDKNKDGLVKVLGELSGWIERGQWVEFAEHLRDAAREINGVVQQLGGWVRVVEILVGLKLAGWLFNVSRGLVGVATAVGAVSTAAGRLPAWLGPVLAGAWAGKQIYDFARSPIGAKIEQLERDRAEVAAGPSLVMRGGIAASKEQVLRGIDSEIAAMRKIEEATRKGTEEGTKKAWSDLLQQQSYTPGEGAGAPQAFGGGKFKMFVPRSAGAPFHTSLGGGGAGGSSGSPGGGGGAGMGTGSHAGLGGGGGVRGGSGSLGGWWTPERQKHAVDYLMKNAGLSEMGAKGLVARWAGVEAARGPGEFNTVGGGHFGIGQWSRSRFRGTTLGDFEGQLALAARELNGSEGRAARALRSARTAEEAAVGASMFERAEGYDPATGRDAFVRKTINAMGALGERGKVSPELMARWRAMMAAAPEKVNKSSWIVSGFRTFAQQAAAYWRYKHGGVIAARPGHSRHEFGLALDVHDPTGWIHRNAQRFGLSFPLGRRDRPHMQMDPDYDGPSFFRGNFGHYYRQHILDKARREGGQGPAPDSPAHPHFYRQHILDHARRAGVIGGEHKVKADGHLKVDFNNLPRGTRTRMASSGLFTRVTLNRGRAMALASEEA